MTKSVKDRWEKIYMNEIYADETEDNLRMELWLSGKRLVLESQGPGSSPTMNHC